jgi:hypothetical protein
VSAAANGQGTANLAESAWTGRVIVFHRAPMFESPVEVAGWLETKGYGTGVRVFLGPDGSWRGSGASVSDALAPRPRNLDCALSGAAPRAEVCGVCSPSTDGDRYPASSRNEALNHHSSELCP